MSDNLSWDKALERLKKGNENFVADKLEGKLQDSERRKRLVSKQEPFAIILSCADSRVVPELAFDTGLGELFVIRVAGNVANTSTIASIEYAVANLPAKLIVVLGHESCGAVGAALAGGDNGYNLNHLLSHLVPALCASEDQSVNTVVKVNAKKTSEELQNRSDIIRSAADEGTTKIIPAYYNLGTGKVDFLQEELA
jgi:carbonic anhydrase